MFPIVESSDKAVQPVVSQFTRKYFFPFDELPVGMSFKVEKDQVKNSSVLRTMASREGLKLGKQFRVIDHGESYEVYCKGLRV